MKSVKITAVIFLAVLITSSSVSAWFGNSKFTKVTPEKGMISLSLKEISDGRAHYYEATSDKGVRVQFFVVKSDDGIVRAAVDACDVCYRAGKGYVQDGNVMVCTNCGMRFATDRINEIKGGCNPAPLERTVDGGRLLIPMAQINASAWLCEFKK